jgi:archaellum component FlaC
MSDAEVKPLIKGLEEKFDKFAGVVLHMDEKLGDITVRLSGLEDKLNTLQTSVDNLTHTVKGFQEEMIVNRNRIDVLEKWAKQVSEKIGIPLPF